MNSRTSIFPFMLLSYASIAFLLLSCAPEDVYAYEDNDIISSHTSNKRDYTIDELNIGMLNAVKKAYQMTDLKFTPLAPINNNSGSFNAGKTYSGVIYSSSRELDMFVGNDVSIHTFMTAINNPKSKIYTEDISKPPYHGTNCRSYYGATCSSFVSHALGLVPRYSSYDFALSDLMEEVGYNNLDSVHIADVLWKKGHVALITDIVKDDINKITKIEISECIGNGCRRYYLNRQQFDELMNTNFKKIYRYNELYKNIDYIPNTEFVAISGESSTEFHYNNDLCVNKGDKSCYREDEEVVINVMRDYEWMEIYKDSILIDVVDYETNRDVTLSNLSYGDYKARLFYKEGNSSSLHIPKMNSRSDDSGNYSDFTYWKVVNINVVADRAKRRVFFSSANATPQCVRYCDIRGDGIVTLNCHILSQEEKERGFINVSYNEINKDYPYVRVHFVTDYGRIINIPIYWFK